MLSCGSDGLTEVEAGSSISFCRIILFHFEWVYSLGNKADSWSVALDSIISPLWEISGEKGGASVWKLNYKVLLGMEVYQCNTGTSIGRFSGLLLLLLHRKTAALWCIFVRINREPPTNISTLTRLYADKRASIDETKGPNIQVPLTCASSPARFSERLWLWAGRCSPVNNREREKHKQRERKRESNEMGVEEGKSPDGTVKRIHNGNTTLLSFHVLM